MQTDQEFSAALELPGYTGYSHVTRRNTSTDPDQATAQTVDAMQRSAIEDSQSHVIQRAAKEATLFASTRGETCTAVFDWIKVHVRFQQDDPILRSVFGLDDELDLLIRPARLITMQDPAEDCDGFTMLCCSMLLAGGVPCEIVTIKADSSDPSRFSHVYCRAQLEDGSLACLDCSHGEYPGWEAPEFYQRKGWGMMQPVARSHGLHGYAGLGMPGDFGGEVGPAVDVPPIDFSPIPTVTSGVSSPAFDWNKFIGQLTAGGLQIAKMQATPVGYMQTPTMTANYGAGGAMPFNLGAGGSLSSGTLLLIGGGLLALMFLGSKR